MYYLLHRQKVPDKVTKMPEGLAELMSDISREVLRSQPESQCIYKFIADYLDALLRVREKTFVTQSIIDELIRGSESVSNFLRQAGLSYEKANKAALIIQKAFHDFLKRKRGIPAEIPKEFNELEVLTELINKCKFTQRELERARPAIRQAYRKFVNEYMTLMKMTIFGAGVVAPIVHMSVKATADVATLEYLHRAATVIQANFRGHLVRQSLKRTSIDFDIFITKIMNKVTYGKQYRKVRPFTTRKYECITDEAVLDTLNKAATIIQRAYRKWAAKIYYHYSVPLDMLNNAAVTIQKIFRGHKARKDQKDSAQKFVPHIGIDQMRENPDGGIIQAYREGLRNPRGDLKSFGMDPNKIEDYDQAATKIQAAYRGREARQQYKRMKEGVQEKSDDVRRKFEKQLPDKSVKKQEEPKEQFPQTLDVAEVKPEEVQKTEENVEKPDEDVVEVVEVPEEDAIVIDDETVPVDEGDKVTDEQEQEQKDEEQVQEQEQEQDQNQQDAANEGS